MEFTVYERLLILNVLQGYQGNLADLRIVRDLTGALAFSEKEHERFGIRYEGAEVRWLTEAGDELVEIEVGPRAREIVRGVFAELDKQERLTLEHLPVYERFLEGERQLREA